MKNRRGKHGNGVINAVNGMKQAFVIEKNFIFHSAAAAAVACFAVIFSTSVFENLILILTVGFVFFAEMANTAIERVVDLICVEIMKNQLKMEEYNKTAKMAKDISAAAVLVTAIMAAAVGIVIFLPKIINVLTDI